MEGCVSTPRNRSARKVGLITSSADAGWMHSQRWGDRNATLFIECCRRCYPRQREIRMLTSTIELLASLCLEAVILLICFCIVGSIVAALRAISSGNVRSTHSGNIDYLGNRPDVFAALNRKCCPPPARSATGVTAKIGLKPKRPNNELVK